MTTHSPQEDPTLVERLALLIAAGDIAALESAVEDLHASDVADVVESLRTDEMRVALVRALPSGLASEALAEMEEGDEAADLLVALAPEESAELIQELADDDAADLIAELEPEDQDRILAELPVEEAGELRGLLQYDEESAGGLMTTALVSVEAHLTAGQAIEQVRAQGREVGDFYFVFVVDADERLQGTVRLADLILADPAETVEQLVRPTVASVVPDEDQEEVGRRITRYNLASIPVVDGDGVLLGRITFDDVIDVIEAEQTEDLLLFSGGSDEEELTGTWLEAVRNRLPWLLLHSLTLSVAVSVIVVFEDLVDQIWQLAVIMPLIAGLGGNAGTQALAVTVRRIATSGGPLEKKRHVVTKELLVALVNGAVVAAVIGLGAGLLLGQPVLGWIVLFAMWGNIVVAGFAGAFIPTVLERMGADPAVASSVFLTTLTDLVGFFLLLSLASAFLV